MDACICAGCLYSAGTGKRNLEKGALCSYRALLSKTSFNEGDSIPGIAHAVVLEHVSKKDQKQ